MSETVGNVVIGVTADIGPLVRETARAKAVMSGFQGAAQRMGAGLDRVSAVTSRLGARMSVVTAALAGVTTVALAMTKNAAAMGDAIGDAAKAAGMGTTAFQEYRFAIKEAADMTDEEFADAMVKLNKSLGEAREGSKSAIAAFERIGVSQADIASGSINTESAMAAFIKKMEETTDPAIAAAMAADLFGKSGASIGAALSGVPGQVGALVERARELGVVMGPDAVRAAGEFDGKMKELGAQFEATKLKIANVLLPVLNDKLIPLLQETVIPAINDVVTKIGEWITAFDGLDPTVQAVAAAIATAFAVGGPALLAIAAVSKALSALVAATGPIGLMIAAAALITAAWATWGDDIKAAVGRGTEWLTGQFKEILGYIDAIIGAAGRVKTAIADALFSEQTQGAMAGGFSREGAENDTGAGAFNTNQLGGTGGSNSTGAAITDGIINGMSARMAERLPEVAAIMQQVTDTANATFGVQSPSTVFAGIGEYIGQGLAQGIASTSGMVNQAVATMGVGAVSSTTGMVSDILGSLGTLFNGSKKFAVAQALVNAWAGATEALKLPFPSNLAAFGKVLATGMSAVKNINSARPGSAGGGSGGGRGGGAASGPPVQNVLIDYRGPEAAMPSFQSLVDLMNKAGKAGYVLNAQITGAR